MQESKWNTISQPDVNKSYLVLLTYLPLKHYHTIPRFLGYTNKIKQELEKARGLIGYSLRVQPFKKQFWTLSVWEDETALNEFAFKGFHSGVMIILKDEIESPKFVRWKISGNEVPPSWEKAAEKFIST